MSTPRVPNYLRSNRKRMALTQDDIAFLLGVDNGGKVCRHERFIRGTDLETALAYEAIFQRSVSELFSGLYQKIEHEVIVRANYLARKINNLKTGPHAKQRSLTLDNLAARGSIKRRKTS